MVQLVMTGEELSKQQIPPPPLLKSFVELSSIVQLLMTGEELSKQQIPAPKFAIELFLMMQLVIAGEEAEGYLILFNSTITEELKKEGYVRDVIRRVQTMRKELDLEYTQNIELTIQPDEFGSKAIKEFEEFIKEETLATKLIQKEPKQGLVKEWTFDEFEVTIGIHPL